MGRELGTSGFAGAYIVYSTTALDPRLVVDTYADLKKADTWPQQGGVVFVYNGMQVAVLDTQDTYMLVDSSKYHTDEGWRKQNTGDELLCNSLTVNGVLTVTSEQPSIFNAPVTFNRKTTHNNGIYVKKGSSSAAIESDGDIIPYNAIYNIGSINKTWNNIYGENGNFYNKLSINSGSLYGPNSKVILNDDGGNLKIGGGYTNDIIWFTGKEYKFDTAGTEETGPISQAVMISKTGYVGIGDVAGYPTEKLHVAAGKVLADGYKLYPYDKTPGYAVMTDGTAKNISDITLNSLTVNGTSTFNGKTTHNGGIDTKNIDVRENISVTGTSLFTSKTTHNGGIETKTLTVNETSEFTDSITLRPIHYKNTGNGVMTPGMGSDYFSSSNSPSLKFFHNTGNPGSISISKHTWEMFTSPKHVGNYEYPDFIIKHKREAVDSNVTEVLKISGETHDATFSNKITANTLNITNIGGDCAVFAGKTTHYGGIDSRTILPTATGSYNLGSSTKEWDNLYVQDATLSNILTLQTGTINLNSTKEILAANASRFELGKGFTDKTLWLWAKDYKFNISNFIDSDGNSKPAVIIAPNGRVGIGDVGGAPVEKLHVSDGWVIANGYKLWRSNVPTATDPGYAVMTNGEYMNISNINSDFTGELGTTNATLAGSRVNVASTGHTHSGTASASGTSVNVASENHSHTITASETDGHIHSFTGSPAISDGSSSNISVVDKDHTHGGTTNGPGNTQTISVASSDHTHDVSDIPTTIYSEFDGTDNQSTGKTTLSITYTASSLDLSITTEHIHLYTPTGSVTSTITATKTVTSTAASDTENVPNTSHTHAFTSNKSTQTSVSVAKSDHTHNVTAKGTIGKTKVSVTGSSNGITGLQAVSSTAHTHEVNVEQTADTNYTLVAKGDHTHTYTPSGNVTSGFAN